MAKNKRADVSHGKTFVFPIDSYEGELAKWKRGDMVRGLVGVYELGADQFHSGTVDDHLKSVGCQFERANFITNMENASADSDKAIGTGYAIAVRDQYRKIRPVLFLRSDIFASGGEHSERDASIRLLVLMHEMGHAEDIANGINYNHETLELDMLGAEVYAHEYVCRHAKKLNYREALGYYLTNFDNWIAKGAEIERLSSQQAMANMDMDALRKATVPAVEQGEQGFLAYLQRIGRYNDYVKYKAKPGNRSS